jgi:glycosyltransferase involved in cell wall biosynthesis
MKTYAMSGLFLTRPMTGMERYALEILLRLDGAIDTEHEQLFLVIPNGVRAAVPPLRNVQVIERGTHRGGNLGGYLWEQVHVARFIRERRADGYLPLSFVTALSPDVVVTIHDGNAMTHPEFYPTLAKKLYRLLAVTLLRVARRNTRRIVTVSHASKEELVSRCGFPADHVTVATPGLEHIPVAPESKPVADIAPDFYFALSSATYNKNFEWVLDQATLQPEDQFVVAGAGDFVSILQHHGLESAPPNLRHLGYISDPERNFLFSSCRAFVFPSRYEGFGMPPLEAACLGAPLVVSDIPPVREIFGEHFSYIDPSLPVADLSQHTNRVDASQLRARYSWDTSAAHVLMLLRSGGPDSGVSTDGTTS